MPLNTQIPVSCIRSTIDETPPVERRRRPRFLLSLDFYNTQAFRSTRAVSEASELSQSFSSSLASAIATPSQKSSGPNTPLDGQNPRWTFHSAKGPSVLTPVFDYESWSAINEFPDELAFTLQTIIPNSPANSKDVAHPGSLTRPPCPIPVTGNHCSAADKPTASVSQPQPNNLHDSASPELSEVDTSDRVARRRSGRSHHPDPVISNKTRRRSPLAVRPTRVTTPPRVVSNYRQLSDKESKGLKLDPCRRHYKCLIDGCERMFSRKSNVENHVRTHLDDKPFVCSLDTCDAAFVRKGDLQRHEEIHRPSRAHMCSCGQTFSRNDALTKHIRKGICGPGGSSVYL